jgi:hypothetical protein
MDVCGQLHDPALIGGKSPPPRYPLGRKLLAAQNPSGRVDEKKNSCTCRESNPNRPACSQSLYWVKRSMNSIMYILGLICWNRMRPRQWQVFSCFFILLLVISIEFGSCNYTFISWAEFLKILYGRLSLNDIWPSRFSAILTVIKPGLHKAINGLLYV